MAAIQEKAPDAEYFAVKIFHAELRASTDDLLRALEWCVENHIDLVNLSLGTRNAKRVPDFEKLVGRGPMIVAAREADGDPCYPGSLGGVIGVGLDWECPREEYRLREGVYYASGYPRPVPGRLVTRNLNGISFAVANVTGLIASGRIVVDQISIASKP